MGWLLASIAQRLPLGPPTAAARERHQALAQLYSTGCYIAYFRLDPRSYLQLAMRLLWPADRLGPSREKVFAYATTGTCL